MTDEERLAAAMAISLGEAPGTGSSAMARLADMSAAASDATHPRPPPPPPPPLLPLPPPPPPRAAVPLNPAELRRATDHFDETRVIGHGGFGKVFGVDGGRLLLPSLGRAGACAVKRLDSDSQQGLDELKMEVCSGIGIGMGTGTGTCTGTRMGSGWLGRSPVACAPASMRAHAQAFSRRDGCPAGAHRPVLSGGAALPLPA